jgi:hypothetical protein
MLIHSCGITLSLSYPREHAHIVSDAHEDPLADVGVSTSDAGGVSVAVGNVRLWP